MAAAAPAPGPLDPLGPLGDAAYDNANRAFETVFHTNATEFEKMSAAVRAESLGPVRDAVYADDLADLWSLSDREVLLRAHAMREGGRADAADAAVANAQQRYLIVRLLSPQEARAPTMYDGDVERFVALLDQRNALAGMLDRHLALPSSEARAQEDPILSRVGDDLLRDLGAVLRGDDAALAAWVETLRNTVAATLSDYNVLRHELLRAVIVQRNATDWRLGLSVTSSGAFETSLERFWNGSVTQWLEQIVDFKNIVDLASLDAGSEEFFKALFAMPKYIESSLALMRLNISANYNTDFVKNVPQDAKTTVASKVKQFQNEADRKVARALAVRLAIALVSTPDVCVAVFSDQNGRRQDREMVPVFNLFVTAGLTPQPAADPNDKRLKLQPIRLSVGDLVRSLQKELLLEDQSIEFLLAYVAGEYSQSNPDEAKQTDTVRGCVAASEIYGLLERAAVHSYAYKTAMHDRISPAGAAADLSRCIQNHADTVSALFALDAKIIARMGAWSALYQQALAGFSALYEVPRQRVLAANALAAQVQAAADSLARTRQEVADLTAANARLTEDLAKAGTAAPKKDASSKTKAALADLQQKLEERDRTIAELHAEGKRLEAEAKQVIQDNEDAGKRLAQQANEKVRELIEERDKARKGERIAKEYHDALYADFTKMKEDGQRFVQNLQAQIQQNEEQIQELKTQHDAEMHTLQIALLAANQDLQTLGAELGATQARAQASEQQAGDLQRQLIRAQDELAERDERLREAADTLAEMSLKRSELQQQISTLQQTRVAPQDVQTLQDELQRAKNDATALLKDKVRLVGQLQAAQKAAAADLANAQAALAAQQKQLEVQAETIANYSAELSRTLKDNKQAKEDRQQALARVRELEADETDKVQKVLAERLALSRKMDELQKLLEAEQEKLNQQVTAHGIAIQQREQQIAALRQALQAATITGDQNANQLRQQLAQEQALVQRLQQDQAALQQAAQTQQVDLQQAAERVRLAQDAVVLAEQAKQAADQAAAQAQADAAEAQRRGDAEVARVDAALGALLGPGAGASVDDKLAELDAQRAALLRDMQSAQAALAALQQQRDEALARVAALQSDNTALVDDAAKQAAEIQRLNGVVKVMEDLAQQTGGQHNLKLAEATAALTAVQDAFEKMRDESTLERDALRATLQERADAIVLLEKQIVELQRDLQDQVDEQRDAEARNDLRLQQDIATLNEARAELTALREAQTQALQDLGDARQERDAQRARADTLSAELQAITQRIDAALAARNAAAAQAASPSATALWDAYIASVQAELDAAKKETSDVQARAAAALQQAQLAAAREINTLQQAIASLKSQGATAAAAEAAKIAALEAEVDASRQAFAKAQQDLAAQKADLDLAQDDAKAARGRITGLEADLSSEQQTIQAAQQRIAELEAALVEQKEKLDIAQVRAALAAGLEQDLQERQKALAAAEAQAQRVAGLEQQIAALQAALATAGSAEAERARLDALATKLAGEKAAADLAAQMDTARIRELEDALAEAQANAGANANTIAALQGDLKKQQDLLAQALAEAARIQGLEHDVASQKQALDDAQAALAAAAGLRTDLAAQKTQLDAALAELTQAAGLQGDLDAARNAAQTEAARAAALQTEIDKLKAAAAADADALRARVAELEAELRRQQAALDAGQGDAPAKKTKRPAELMLPSGRAQQIAGLHDALVQRTRDIQELLQQRTALQREATAHAARAASLQARVDYAKGALQRLVQRERPVAPGELLGVISTLEQAPAAA